MGVAACNSLQAIGEYWLAFRKYDRGPEEKQEQQITTSSAEWFQDSEEIGHNRMNKGL